MKTALTYRYKNSKTTHDGGLITAIKNDTDNTMDNRTTRTKKQKWEGNNSMGVLND